MWEDSGVTIENTNITFETGFSRKFRCWQCTLASVQHLNGLLVFRAIIILFIRFYVLSFGRALFKVGFYPRYVALNLGFSLSIPYWLHTGSNEYGVQMVRQVDNYVIVIFQLSYTILHYYIK